jgi:hypothetical protein
MSPSALLRALQRREAMLAAMLASFPRAATAHTPAFLAFHCVERPARFLRI